MLHDETVNAKTLGLLKKLQAIPEFSELRLVGGTALALQTGHRISIDIDLFGFLNADTITIAKRLDRVGKVTVIKKSENINIYIIDGVKVDIVNYHYKWLEASVKKDAIVLASKKDIAAMKLAAITGRGTKKDFIDLFFLLKDFNLEEILSFYKQKYHDGSLFLVLKSLSYFEDADKEECPKMLKHNSWEEMKLFIEETLDNYLKKQ